MLTAERPSALSVRQALQSLLASLEFSRAPRHSRFLAFVVEETLSGRGGDLKEYTIGVDVFGKSDTYDPRTDSTVRTEASKIRKRLDTYYANEGASSAIRITLPRGSYVPEFTCNPPIAQPIPTVPQAPSRAYGRRLVWLALLTILASAAAASIWIALTRTRPPGPPVLTRLYTVTSLPGAKRQPAWSPDGQSVVYSWERTPGNYDLYVATLNSQLPPRQLTDDPGQDWAPAWSPDGHVIAFVRNPLTANRVVLIPAGGGPERTLEGITSLRLAWTPDSRSLLTQTVTAPGGPQALYQVDTVSGARKQITFPGTPEDPTGQTNFALSPAGDRIAFLTRRQGALTLQTSPLHPWAPKTIATLGPDFGGLAWYPSGNGLFVASGRLRFVAEGQPDSVPIAGMDINLGQIAATRTAPAKVAFVSSGQSWDLWQTGGDSEQTAAPLISTAAQESAPRFNRQGTQFVFTSDRTGSRQLWLAASDGHSPRQLTTGNACGPSSADWSLDDNTLVFDCEQNGHSALYLLNPNGGEPAKIESANPDSYRPTFSADGHWIFFTAPAPAQSQMQIWKLPVKGKGASVLVHPGPAYEAKEAPGGQSLYFTKEPKQPGLWQYSYSNRRDTLVTDRACSGWWDLNAKGLYWTTETAETLTFWRWNPNGASIPIATAKGYRVPSQAGIAVSPTGKILFLKATKTADDLMVAEVAPGHTR